MPSSNNGNRLARAKKTSSRTSANRSCRHAKAEQVPDVLSRVEKLADVLAANNPTMGNLELSFHIDRIDCFSDGRVEMRTCKLGALTGAADLVADYDGGQARVVAASIPPTLAADDKKDLLFEVVQRQGHNAKQNSVTLEEATPFF
jgi:hypothetical protein